MKRRPTRRAWLALLAAVAGAALAPLGSGCSSNSVPSPFPVDAGSDAPIDGDGGGGTQDSGPDADPTLGGPCSIDAQCDDSFDCTFDSCDDDLQRCRFVPDDSQCQNDLFCDGMEVCLNDLGCRSGEPITCSDGSACTINTCDEANDNCLSEPRDVDQDGDPDDHCGGDDCNDNDPSVSSLQAEICANGKDDNCDEQTDEAACTAPQYDTCLDPFSLSQPGSYALNSAAAQLDYAASCGVISPVARELVAAVLLDPGPVRDVQLTLRSDAVDVSLALMANCGQPASELGCSPGFFHPDGGRVSKVRARSVGDPQAAQALAAYLASASGSDLTLRYELLPASSKPSNETCGSAAPLLPDTPVVASVVDADADLASACTPGSGDLVYQFTLNQTSDVDVYASSVDGDGLPVLSLRDANCALPEDEISCNVGSNAHIFRHSLPAGDYFVAVAASAPTDVLLSLQLSAPSQAPLDEDCSSAPALAANQTIDVDLSGHQDDINSGCLPGGTDAAYALELSEASDVLLLGRFSQGDNAAVELMLPACADPSDSLECGQAAISPARGQVRNVPAGSYRVVAESSSGQPMQVTALVRPAVPPTLVPFANACGDVQAIPSNGGFFQGVSSNAQADFNAGCDVGGQPQGGAPDQILQLTLSAPKRVVLDMQGSGYATLLNVREGPSCPGNELLMSCAAGYFPERSFLDLDLPASTYFIQIDGYAGQSGAWFLDVFVVDP